MKTMYLVCIKKRISGILICHFIEQTRFCVWYMHSTAPTTGPGLEDKERYITQHDMAAKERALSLGHC